MIQKSDIQQPSMKKISEPLTRALAQYGELSYQRENLTRQINSIESLLAGARDRVAELRNLPGEVSEPVAAAELAPATPRPPFGSPKASAPKAVAKKRGRKSNAEKAAEQGAQAQAS